MNLQEFEEKVREAIEDELLVTNVSEVVNDGLKLLAQHISQDVVSSYYKHCLQLLKDSGYNLSLFKQQMSLQNSMVRRVYCDYAQDRMNQERSKWLQCIFDREIQVRECLKNIQLHTYDGSIVTDDSSLYHDIAFACIRFFEFPQERYLEEYGICQDEIAFCKLFNSIKNGGQIEKCVIKDASGDSYKMSSELFTNVFVKEFMPFFKERHLITTTITELGKISKALKYEQGKTANRLIRELVHLFVNHRILKENRDDSSRYDPYHLDDGFNPEITYAANPILDIMFHMGYLERGNRFDTNEQPGLLRKEYKDRIEEALKAQTLQYVFDLQAHDMFNDSFLFV